MNDRAQTPGNASTVPVGVLDLVGFLFGIRGSIERLLQARQSLVLATALVFTAALAREYDAVSLTHKPWDLLGSFGASIILCTIIYLMVIGCLWIGWRQKPSARDYKVFLTGYWLTAPLAWLYAFPIETMASEIESLRFNLTALSVVSIWRVLLFSRVVSIIYAIAFWRSLVWVLVPCMAIAFYFLVSAILPMVSIMGGIRMTETQAMIYAYQNNVASIIFFAAVPVLVLFAYSELAPAHPSRQLSITTNSNRIAGQLWVVPVLVLGLLGVGCSKFQPLLWRAEMVNRLLVEGKFAEAVAELERQGREQFPEAWEPPPNFSDAENGRPSMLAMLHSLREQQASIWINDLLLDHGDEILLRQAGWPHGAEGEELLLQVLPSDQQENLEQLLEAFVLLGSIEQSDPAAQQRARALEAIVRQAIAAKNDFAAKKLEDEEVDSPAAGESSDD